MGEIILKKDLFGVCPYTTAQKILSGKWTLLILYHLSTQTMRFGELQRALPEMTQATLSRQLKEMEQNGLIVRTAYNQIPPKVEYSLDKLGMDFLPVLNALKVWGGKYIAHLNEHTNESKQSACG